MERQRTIYGWQDATDNKFCLSPVPAGTKVPRPANRYETREAAVAEAERRGCLIEWAD